MSRILTVFVLLLGFSFSASAQYDINFKLKNYDQDTLVIGYYYGSQTLVQDTLVRNNDEFRLKGDKDLPAGVYMALRKPDNNYVQFFIPKDDQKFDVEWDVTKTDPSFKGSRDNQIFEDYAAFLSRKRARLDQLQKDVEISKIEAKDTTAMLQEINKLDLEVMAYQRKVAERNPGTLSAIVLNGNIDPDMPAFDPNDPDFEQKRYLYYKEHFFDKVDLGDPQLLRTPFINEKIMYYMDKLVSYDPNDVIKEVDFLLSKMESAPDTRKFYIGEFLNKYANTNIIGLDKVFVHIADKYYSAEKTPWIDAENLKEIKKMANNMRSTLAGSIFPEVTTFKKDGTPVKINDIASPYKIVVFWSHTCSHCKESMPALIDFDKEFSSQGVKVITVCTKGRKRAAECMEYVDERGDMGAMLNTFDAKRTWAKSVYVPSTPGVFLLDKNNKIIFKDLPVKKLSQIMPKVFQMYPQLNK